MRDPHTWIIAFLLAILFVATMYAYKATADDAFYLIPAEVMRELVQTLQAQEKLIEELKSRKCI